jgi:hypothetical protein
MRGHLARLDVLPGDRVQGLGTEATYAALRAMDARPRISAFLCGAEAAAAHAAGRKPDAPQPWLARSPDRSAVIATAQPKTDREALLWRIP